MLDNPLWKIDHKERENPFKHSCEYCNGKNDFWESKLEWKGDKYARINNNHYIIGDRTERSNQNGMSGAWNTIQFDDGRIVKTCDLWHQGEIPECYRDRLPNNAKFL